MLPPMSLTNTDHTNADLREEESQPETEVVKKLDEQVSKGLSQPPSKAQVPPATAAEELVQ